MFKLCLYLYTLDLTKAKVLLNLGLKSFGIRAINHVIKIQKYPKTQIPTIPQSLTLKKQIITLGDFFPHLNSISFSEKGLKHLMQVI